MNKTKGRTRDHSFEVCCYKAELDRWTKAAGTDLVAITYSEEAYAKLTRWVCKALNAAVKK